VVDQPIEHDQRHQRAERGHDHIHAGWHRGGPSLALSTTITTAEDDQEEQEQSV